MMAATNTSFGLYPHLQLKPGRDRQTMPQHHDPKIHKSPSHCLLVAL
jgi:hypothetical protein